MYLASILSFTNKTVFMKETILNEQLSDLHVSLVAAFVFKIVLIAVYLFANCSKEEKSIGNSGKSYV